ncbi:MAG: AMP-binding protein [Oscillospiraceae bacterium]|nr:AMP-binding protein [Oscillospiraceae bacterium]
MEKNKYKPHEIKDIKDMVNKSAEMYADEPAYIFKTLVPGNFDKITFKELKEQVDQLGTALLNLGLKGKRIGIISENRYEWALAYLAIVSGVGVVVPLDHALTDIEIENLVKRSEMEAIFYSKNHDECMNNLRKKADNNVSKFISMDFETEYSGILSQKELLKEGEKLLEVGNDDFLKAEINAEEMGIMLFTSGTTAMSKAVMLSHKNLCTNVMDLRRTVYIGEGDRVLSFLPLHHTFEATASFLHSVYGGVTVAYCDGIRHMADNIKEYQITVLITVPAVMENVYKKVWKNIEKQGKTSTVKKAIKISRFLLKFGIDIRRKLFKEIHENFGGALKLAVVGAAAVDTEVEIGLADFGIRTIQGYGLTETSPVVAVMKDGYTKVGSVGKALPSLKVKIANPGENGVGEIIVKGDSVMIGYYQNEKANKEVFKDGWFYTGDLGYIDDEGYIFVKGRQKNVIVLKNGKNIFPEEIETLINRIPGVKESFVYGKEDKADDLKVCAKVVYDKDAIKEEYGVEGEEEIKKILWEKIKEINKTMPTYKYVKELAITEQEFVKTTTQKIKRHEEIKRV